MRVVCYRPPQGMCRVVLVAHLSCVAAVMHLPSVNCMHYATASLMPGTYGLTVPCHAVLCCPCAAAQEPFSCLPATMLASSIQTPVASATWEGCLTSNTYLAWYGERCGSSFSQVRWTGVYAFDKTTGARLASCIKQRPATGTLSADLKFWLGECGVTPPALATVPNRVCQDPYVRKFAPGLLTVQLSYVQLG